MFKSILVPIDLADTDLAKPAIATAATLSQTWSGTVRLLNVLPMTPVMLAEYVPADFDAQQRQTSEEALAIVARESGIEASRISGVVRQGGIYHEILEEAASVHADLIVGLHPTAAGYEIWGAAIKEPLNNLLNDKGLDGSPLPPESVK